MLDWAGRKMPKAKLYLLGHSEGTYVGLQAVHERGGVSGVALIGLAAAPVQCLVMEQTIYRPLQLVADLDLDHDGSLDGKELAAPGGVAAALKAQLVLLDLDGDGRISILEIKAGNFSNLVLKPLIDSTVPVYEATHPTIARIVSEATYPICFFQGLLDNQTPAYQTKAFELVNKAVWKKPNLTFQYFENLGHALDPRDRYDDIEFRPMDPKARAQLADRLDRLFGE